MHLLESPWHWVWLSNGFPEVLKSHLSACSVLNFSTPPFFNGKCNYMMNHSKTLERRLRVWNSGPQFDSAPIRFTNFVISLHSRFTDTTARLRTLILKHLSLFLNAHLATESVANNPKYLYGTLLCYSKTRYNIVRMVQWKFFRNANMIRHKKTWSVRFTNEN